MLVKEVVALAAETLGRSDLADSLSSLTGDPQGELKSLLRCYNLIENEVALDFFPLKAVEVFAPNNGQILFARFQNAPVNILQVTNASGDPLEYSVFVTHLVVPAQLKSVFVTYTYRPAAKTFKDTVAFPENISARLLAFGVASEFCITNRQFEEGAMWGRRYRDALRAAGIYRRTLSVRSRRWI